MNNENVYYETDYATLIYNKHLNRAQREFVFDMCRKGELADVYMRIIASGKYDVEQMKQFYCLFNSEISFIRDYRIGYYYMKEGNYNGEQMRILIEAMENNCPNKIMNLMYYANEAQMVEILDSYLKGVSISSISRYADKDFSASRMSYTKKMMLAYEENSRIFDYWEKEDEVYIEICKARLKGVPYETIDFNMKKAKDIECFEALNCASADGISTDDIEFFISQNDSALKINAILGAYKEYYNDTFCKMLTEIPDDYYMVADEKFSKDGIIAYSIQLNEVYEITKALLEQNENELIDEHLIEALESLNITYDEKEYLLYGEAYIDNHIKEQLKDNVVLAELQFMLVSDQVVYNKYHDEIKDYRSLLQTIFYLKNPTVFKHRQEIIDFVVKYQDLEKQASEFQFVSKEKNVFTFKRDNVQIKVSVHDKVYRFDSILFEFENGNKEINDTLIEAIQKQQAQVQPFINELGKEKINDTLIETIQNRQVQVQQSIKELEKKEINKGESLSL